MTIPRPEYPRPQLVREDWLCLNGEWEFEIDQGDSGLERGLLKRSLASRITVPFCPESPLSGVGNDDFLNAVWYRREVLIPPSWSGRRVLLHFQAVDYDATVWVNGVEVGRHRGGFTPFTCDLQGIAAPGRHAVIVLRARDDRHQPQPRGKQCPQVKNFSAFYTRTTGIWQTVWLEPVPEVYLQRPKITPDVAGGLIHLEQPLSAALPGGSIRARLRDGAGVVAFAEAPAETHFAARLSLSIDEARRRLWSPEDPFLYDLELELVDAQDRVVDRVASYAGLRSVTIDGPAIKINGRTIFQRLVLDQGYYPDGIMTAPSDDALKRDIELSLEAGFNGARLHQKVFEERFLYHADRMGYLVWGEFGDWGCAHHGPAHDHQRVSATYITQWLEALARDYSHPSIIGWCPLNETFQPLGDRLTDLDDVTHGMFLAAKAMDSTRPVLDVSGYSHRVRQSDVYDSHDYEQDPERFAATHAGLAEGRPHVNKWGDQGMSIPWNGQPYFVSEFGGIWWNPKAAANGDSWGYGTRPQSIEEFYDRFERLCRALLGDPLMFGYCYTQLTDVFQEQNGIYAFDRSPKFDMQRIRAIQQQEAAIEARAGVMTSGGKPER